MASIAGVVRDLRDHWSDPLYRNSYFLFANTILISGSGFLFWLVASHAASPERIGFATATISALTLLALFARLGFDVALLRYLPVRRNGEAHQLLDTALTATSALAAIMAIVFVLGTPIWSPALRMLLDRPAYAAGFALLTVVWTMGNMLDAVFTARRDAMHVLLKNGVHTVLKLVLVVALAGAFAAPGIVFSWVGSMAIAILAAGVLWLPRAEPGWRPRARVSGAVLRETLRASFANYAVSLALAIPLSIGSLVVLHRFGAADAGSFYILWMFGSLALAIPSAFGQSFLVEMMHRGGHEREAMRIPKRGLAIATVAGVATVIAGEVALPLFGAHYRALEGWPLVPFGLSAFPGYLLYARMAQFRVTHQNVSLVVPPLLTVGLFVGSLWLPWSSVALSGWTWLAALGIGAVAAFVEPVRPAGASAGEGAAAADAP